MLSVVDMHSDSEPVVDGLGEYDVVLAKNQPQYRALRALVSRTPEGLVLSRWTPNEEQRAAIGAGADVYFEVMTFHGHLQPQLCYVGENPDPAYFKERYRLIPSGSNGGHGE